MFTTSNCNATNASDAPDTRNMATGTTTVAVAGGGVEPQQDMQNLLQSLSQSVSMCMHDHALTLRRQNQRALETWLKEQLSVAVYSASSQRQCCVLVVQREARDAHKPDNDVKETDTADALAVVELPDFQEHWETLMSVLPASWWVEYRCAQSAYVCWPPTTDDRVMVTLTQSAWETLPLPPKLERTAFPRTFPATIVAVHNTSTPAGTRGHAPPTLSVRLPWSPEVLLTPCTFDPVTRMALYDNAGNSNVPHPVAAVAAVPAVAAALLLPHEAVFDPALTAETLERLMHQQDYDARRFLRVVWQWCHLKATASGLQMTELLTQLLLTNAAFVVSDRVNCPCFGVIRQVNSRSCDFAATRLLVHFPGYEATDDELVPISAMAFQYVLPVRPKALARCLMSLSVRYQSNFLRQVYRDPLHPKGVYACTGVATAKSADEIICGTNVITAAGIERALTIHMDQSVIPLPFKDMTHNACVHILNAGCPWAASVPAA